MICSQVQGFRQSTVVLWCWEFGWGNLHHSHNSLLRCLHWLLLCFWHVYLYHWGKTLRIEFLKRKQWQTLRMLFKNDNAIYSSLQIQCLNMAKYEPEMVVSQAPRVMQIVSHDLFKAFSIALRTHFAVIMLHFPEKTGLRKRKALPLMASLFCCLQAVWHVSSSMAEVQTTTEKWLLIFWLGTCEITRHKSDWKLHVLTIW